MPLPDLIAIGLGLIVFAFLISRALARTVFTERRPQLPSYDAYGDGLTAADVERIHAALFTRGGQHDHA